MDFRIWKEKKSWILILATCATGTAAQEDVEPGVAISRAPHKAEIALECRFDLECYEGEACLATEFNFALKGLAGGLGPDAMAALVKMESLAGSVELLGTRSGDITVLSGGGIEARHMLTLDGQSVRYTLHYSDGPLVISYLGLCTE